MSKPTNPAYYGGPGEPGRAKELMAVEAEGPENCYGCGAAQGTPHSPLCYVFQRGEVEWARSEESKSDMIEHKMVSTRGQRGWRKRDDD